MFFPDLLTSDEHRRQHKETCADFAAFFSTRQDTFASGEEVA